MVFWRNIAWALAGSGAYCGSNARTTCVVPSDLASVFATWPTVTPLMRTSAFSERLLAFGKSALTS